MSQVIIYKQDNGVVATVHPTPEALALFGGIMEIAMKDVPNGKPFKVIDSLDIPADRASWVVNDADLTDGVGQG